MTEQEIRGSDPPSLRTLGDPEAELYVNRSLNDINAPLISPTVYTAGGIHNNSQDYVQQHHHTNTTEISNCNRQQNCGMTPVRRMFCLLTLFDGLLMFLMWIIYLRICGGSLFDRMKQEVENFEFRKSFFDLTALSFLRSLFLLSVYGSCCKSLKWYAVAFTTATSTVFLLVKVFMTSFRYGQPMNYVLVIFSFVICWCEAWHFDFQVVPYEMSENKLVTSIANSIVGSNYVVIPSEFPGVGHNEDYYSRGGMRSSAFFTPYGGSIYRPRTPSENSSDLSNLSLELNSALEDDKEYIQVADDTVHLVFRMLYVNDGWALERVEDTIVVHSREFQGIGKVYKLDAIMDISRKVLDKLFWEDIDSQPSWNATVKESQVVRKINNKTEILHTIAAEGGGGVISSRDFVCVRRRTRKDPLTLICVQSINTDLVPANKSIIRGTNGPGGFILRELPCEHNKTEFTWLLNTNLKGWLPQRLVEQSIVSVMVETCKDIVQHASSLGNELYIP